MDDKLKHFIAFDSPEEAAEKEKERKRESTERFRFWFATLAADLLSVAAIIISIIAMLK